MTVFSIDVATVASVQALSDQVAALTTRVSALEAGTPAAGSLTMTGAASSGVVNLTTVGVSDWAAWPAGVYNHKASGGSKISNVTRIGGGTYGTWSDSRVSRTWTDGTPTVSSSGNQSYIWCNGAANSGWTFTAPADTTQRKLHVMCGTPSGGTLKIVGTLSDGSAPAMTMSKSDTSASNGLTVMEYVFTYKAAAAAKLLTISLTHTSSGDPSCDLYAAWLE